MHTSFPRRRGTRAVLPALLLASVAALPEAGAQSSGTRPSSSSAHASQGQGQQLSPRDSVRATIGGATVSVNYGRPSRRGRKIFGELVPFNQVWRTGANAATAFTTTAPLEIGGTTVPAGSYTLYTLPTAQSAQLIINKQTGQWGTTYDEKQDLARVDLKATKLAQPVEQFTISIVPSGSTGGVLRMAWEETQWEVPLTVKK